MSTKHTPGPWHYQEDSDAYTHIVRTGADRLRFLCQLSQDTSGESEANARLIAAAPVLLKRTETNERVFDHVRKCVDWLRKTYANSPHIQQWADNLLSPVNAQKSQNEAAIAKATGQ